MDGVKYAASVASGKIIALLTKKKMQAGSMVGYLPSEFADPMHKIFLYLVSPLDQISLSLAFTWCRCGDGTSANGLATITGLGLGRCLSFALGLVFLGFELCRDAKDQYN